MYANSRSYSTRLHCRFKSCPDCKIVRTWNDEDGNRGWNLGESRSRLSDRNFLRIVGRHSWQLWWYSKSCKQPGSRNGSAREKFCKINQHGSRFKSCPDYKDERIQSRKHPSSCVTRGANYQ